MEPNGTNVQRRVQDRHHVLLPEKISLKTNRLTISRMKPYNNYRSLVQSETGADFWDRL